MATVSGNDENIWIAIADGKTDLALSLIRSGTFDINVKDENGYTPLHAAASYGDEAVLRCLLELGADVNIRDNGQETPLHYCEEVKIAQILLDHGADPCLHNSDAQTPADSAEEDENEELQEFLQRAMEKARSAKAQTVPQLQQQKDEADPSLLLISFADLGQLTYITGLLDNARLAGSEPSTTSSATATIWSGIRGDLVIVEAGKDRIDWLEQHLQANKDASATPLVTFASEGPAGVESILGGAPSLSTIKVKRLTRRQAKALIDWSSFGEQAERMKEDFELNKESS